jgi:hypothetical protein
MKNVWIAFLLMFSVAFVSTTPELYAQKKKKESSDKGKGKEEEKERKEWKKRIKEMDPLAIRDMSEQNNKLKKENAALKKQVIELQDGSSSTTTMMDSKNQEIASLQTQVDSLKKTVDNNVSSSGDDYTKGVVYKVQIGAFRNKDLSKFQDKGNFWIEEEDGVKKYTIAYFRDYWEADTFKQYMIKMGVKDAWIVAYENNARRDIKQVLDAKSIEEKQKKGK